MDRNEWLDKFQFFFNEKHGRFLDKNSMEFKDLPVNNWSKADISPFDAVEMFDGYENDLLYDEF